MKIPKGMTESEVLTSIERIANGLAYKYNFGDYSIDDMKQEARIEAIDGLERYDSTKGKLETFLWTHVNNRLYNLKRNKFARPDKPCLDCPLNAYDPHRLKSTNQCTAYDDRADCEPFASWEKRNSSKKNIMSPIGMGNVQDEKERNMRQEDSIAQDIDYTNMVALLDEKIPVPLRKSWIKMKNDIKLSKADKTKLLDVIRLILAEENYGP